MRRTACSKQKSKEETISIRQVARYGDRRGEMAARGAFLLYFINIDRYEAKKYICKVVLHYLI